MSMSASSSSATTATSTTAGKSVDRARFRFEIFGRVQKVSFRAYTQKQADKLGLQGWVENTPAGTVVGEIEGPKDKCAAMKTWLSTKGSPSCKIERFEFEDASPASLSKRLYRKFEIRK